MELLSTLYSGGVDPFRAALGKLRADDEPRPYRELYDILDAYYHNTGLYDALRHLLNQQGVWMRDIKSLRNPAHAVVEFYAATTVPGPLERALPILTDNEAIIGPINQLYAWSNWQVRKQVNVRRSATFGDSFVRVATRAGSAGTVRRVFYELIHPRNLTAFDVDERDYLTFVRVDIPQKEQLGTEVRRWTYTEVWDKSTDRYRVWNHEKGEDVSLDDLGTPDQEESIEAYFGVDFIPIVRFPHMDIGQERGQSAFVNALDGIDELNAQATRLHQMLFRHNKVTHVLEANQTGAAGEPLAAPRLSIHPTGSDDDDDESTVRMGDEMFYRLPGMSRLGQLVPNIQYDAALRIVESQMKSLETWDLPELTYYRIPDRSDLSGRAIRYMLTVASDRANEVRGNNEAAQIRLNQMGLTIGQVNRVPGFEPDNIGTFDATDSARNFNHHFEERDIIVMNDIEIAEAETAQMRALEVKRNDLGVPRQQVWKEAGYTDEEIKEMVEAANREQAELEEQILRRLDRGMTGTNDDV